MNPPEEKHPARRVAPWRRHVVLVAPQVHWNTGNIGRTCLGAQARLHLIRPLGFSLDDKCVKRAGLDYWTRVKIDVWEDFETFLDQMEPREGEIALFTKNAEKSFYRMKRPERLFLVFGSETHGLPPEILGRFPDESYHIPIAADIRCLNLSTAVGIALFESLRDFDPVNEWTCGNDSQGTEPGR